MSNDTSQPTVQSSEDEVIDLQAYARDERLVPKGRRYRILIDRKTYVVKSETITGKELLELAGKTPVEQFMVSQKLRGGQVKRINYDESVDLTKPGIERFVTMPLDQTEGDGGGFNLPEGDKNHLDQTYSNWKTMKEGANNWLLLFDFQIPSGYEHEAATLALMIPPAYPDVQLDMAYFHPHLKLKSGKSIKNLSEQQINGEQFQRWSRHRKSSEEWRPELDSVGTHILQVISWLEREVVT